MSVPIASSSEVGQQMPHLRIGGVPEHFNLPWRLAIEEGLFERELGCTAEWIDYPGGTGKIMAALESGEVDIATPLTEGAVTAIANGNKAKLVRLWTQSPLLWGIHVAGGDKSSAYTVEDLDANSDKQRFAISRFGSGSELMSRVLAEDRGWSLSDGDEQGEAGGDDDERGTNASTSAKKWVVIKNIAGALKALPEGDADIFLWNKSMTQQHCDDGTFRRVGVLPTPWPAFVVATRDGVDAELVSKLTTVALARAAVLHVSNDTVPNVMRRFGLAEADVRAWLAQVVFEAPSAALDLGMLASVTARMSSLGRIEPSLATANNTVRDACVSQTCDSRSKVNAAVGSKHATADLDSDVDERDALQCAKRTSSFANDGSNL